MVLGGIVLELMNVVPGRIFRRRHPSRTIVWLNADTTTPAGSYKARNFFALSYRYIETSEGG